MPFDGAETGSAKFNSANFFRLTFALFKFRNTNDNVYYNWD
mgnify:CR=1 FL=1